MTIDTNGTYIITQDNPSTSTQNTITIKPGVTAKITLKNVNIDVSNIQNKCAFDMHGESESQITTVTLKWEGTNTLKSGHSYAGIYTGQFGTLIMQDSGTENSSLSVYSGAVSAAIGGSRAPSDLPIDEQVKRAHGGTIRIEGGTIKLYPNEWAYSAAIGDADYPGTPQINDASASIIITGGKISIIDSYNRDVTNYIGRGNDLLTTGGRVEIWGGEISITSSTQDCIFNSETVIVGPNTTITGELNQPNIYDYGFVFTDDVAEVKGEVVLPDDMEIPSGKTLFLPEGATLIIPEGRTLINNGKIVYNGGAILDASRITNNGTVINMPVKLTTEMVQGTDETLTYTGTAKMFSNLSVQYNNETYTENTDYTVTYANNTDACENTATVTIKMIDSNISTLIGEVTIPFSIAKAAAPTITDFSGITDKEYDGTPISITAPAVTGENLTSASATLSYKLATDPDENYVETAPTEAGTYTVKASFVSPNHQDAEAKTADFQITQATNAWTTELPTTEVTFAYGEDKYPTAVAKYGEVAYSYYKEDNTTLLPNKPTDVGTYYVSAKVEATNSYLELVETDKVKFTITKPSGNSWLLPLTTNRTSWMYGETKYYYRAEALHGKVTYTYSDAADGTYTETRPTDVGTWYVKAEVEETLNYPGLAAIGPKLFTITAKPLEAEMVSLSSTSLSYGNRPTITVKDGDNTLVQDRDYTIEWPANSTGAGTHTVTITGKGNYSGSVQKSYSVSQQPYNPPSIDPEPTYYTVKIPKSLTGAILTGGGTFRIKEGEYVSFRIELDPSGAKEYPIVRTGSWGNKLTPDSKGNYQFRVSGNMEVIISEVPADSYDYYQLSLPTDSVVEKENEYWSAAYIEVDGAKKLRAAAIDRFLLPFGATVTLRPIETERRKFLMWEDGSTQKERTLTLRANQEIKALWKRISPTGIEAIADGSVIRGERGQLYIEVPEPCDVTLYTYGGVPVRVARLAAGANRLANLNAGLYLVKIGAAPAVPVRIR